MKKEAVGYCRVSSIGQQKSGTGLNRQDKEIRAYAGKTGYKISKVYRESFTGTESERPIFETMIADLLGNGCRVIIVECLDRLARDLSIQLQIIAMLAGKGITLINAMTGQDVTNPTDDMTRCMLQVQGSFAELDKRLLVRKLRKGRDAKSTKSRRCEGRKPFGTSDGEQAVLIRIKELHRKQHGVKRLGPSRIARILNKENLPTRSGGQWYGAVVKRIIERKGWHSS